MRIPQPEWVRGVPYCEKRCAMKRDDLSCLTEAEAGGVCTAAIRMGFELLRTATKLRQSHSEAAFNTWFDDAKAILPPEK